jgi:hypothetical protein
VGSGIKWGTLASGVGIALTLLFGDVGGGRAFNQYQNTGAEPLWPQVLNLALLGPGLGMLGGIALPLYRFRRGGYVFGLFMYVGFFALGLAAAAVQALLARLGAQWAQEPTWPTLTEPWRVLAILVCMGIVFASMAQSLAPSMRGEPESPPG